LNVFGDKSVERIEYLRIYDRWGNLVYSTIESFLPNDTSIGWDGFHRGKLLSTDVFVYTLQATYIDNRTEIFTGDVTLLR